MYFLGSRPPCCAGGRIYRQRVGVGEEPRLAWHVRCCVMCNMVSLFSVCVCAYACVRVCVCVFCLLYIYLPPPSLCLSMLFPFFSLLSLFLYYYSFYPLIIILYEPFFVSRCILLFTVSELTFPTSNPLFNSTGSHKLLLASCPTSLMAMLRLHRAWRLHAILPTSSSLTSAGEFFSIYVLIFFFFFFLDLTNT